MHTDYLLLGPDDAELGWNLVSGAVSVVYAICIFCFLIGIMGNTKRTNELLTQLISFQRPSSSTDSLPPALPTRTQGPLPVAPASKPIPTPVSASIDPQSPASKPIPPSTEPFRPF